MGLVALLLHAGLSVHKVCIAGLTLLVAKSCRFELWLPGLEWRLALLTLQRAGLSKASACCVNIRRALRSLPVLGNVPTAANECIKLQCDTLPMLCRLEQMQATT